MQCDIPMADLTETASDFAVRSVAKSLSVGIGSPGPGVADLPEAIPELVEDGATV